MIKTKKRRYTFLEAGKKIFEDGSEFVREDTLDDPSSIIMHKKNCALNFRYEPKIKGALIPQYVCVYDLTEYWLEVDKDVYPAQQKERKR